MTSIIKRALITTLAGTTVLAGATAAMAEERVCNGRIGAVSLDNIAVPDGATCYLTGTRANGTLKVGTHANLVASGISINGNIQAEGANSVTVSGKSFVGGSVQIVQGRSASISGASINGDLYFSQQIGPVSARGNMIGGNLQAFENTGGAAFNSNFMKGNMQCKANVPAPTGGGNQASSKEDQCERL